MRALLTGLYIATAAFAFVVAFPQLSHANIRTTSAAACTPIGTSDVNCGITVGTDFPTANLTYAYFDFDRYAGGSGSVALQVFKTSYTGTVYTDSSTTTSTGQVDYGFALVHTVLNANSYDYMSAAIAWPSGVTVVFQGVALLNNL